MFWWIRIFLFLLIFIITLRALNRLLRDYSIRLIVSFITTVVSISFFIPHLSMWAVIYSIPVPFYLLVAHLLRIDTTLSFLGQNKEKSVIQRSILQNARINWQLYAIAGVICSPFLFELFHFIHSIRFNHPILFWCFLAVDIILGIYSFSLLYCHNVVRSSMKADSEEESEERRFEVMGGVNELLMNKYMQENRFRKALEKNFGNINSLVNNPEKFQDYIRFSKLRIEDLLKSERYLEVFDNLETMKGAIWRQIFATHKIGELDLLSEKKQERFSGVAKELRLLWAHVISFLPTKQAKLDWGKIEEYERDIRKQVKTFFFNNEMLYKLTTSQSLTFGNFRDIIGAPDREYLSVPHKEAAESIRYILQSRRIFTPVSKSSLSFELSYFLALCRSSTWFAIKQYLVFTMLRMITRDIPHYRKKVSGFLKEVVSNSLFYPGTRRFAKEILDDIGEDSTAIRMPFINSLFLVANLLISTVLAVATYFWILSWIFESRHILIGCFIIIFSFIAGLVMKWGVSHGHSSQFNLISIASSILISPLVIVYSITSGIIVRIIRFIFENHERGRDFEKDLVVRIWKRSLQNFPGNYFLRILLARELIRTERYDESLEQLICASVSSPANYEIYYYLGDICAKLGERRLALEYLSHYLMTSPTGRKVPKAYLCKGDCYHYLGEYPDAIDEYRKAAQFENSADLAYKCGRVFEDMGFDDHALRLYILAFEKRPDEKTYCDALQNYIGESFYLDQNNRTENVLSRLIKSASAKQTYCPFFNRPYPMNQKWIERATLWRELRRAFDNPNVSMIGLVGAKGVGKSVLARQLAEHIVNSQEYGVLWWHFDKGNRFESAIASFLQNVFGLTVDLHIQEFRSFWKNLFLLKQLMSQKHWCIVLDGVENAQILLPKSNHTGKFQDDELCKILGYLSDVQEKNEFHTKIIVTTRLSLNLQMDVNNKKRHYHEIQVDVYTPEEARKAVEVWGFTAAIEEIDEVTKNFKYHPSAISSLCRHLGSRGQNQVRNVQLIAEKIDLTIDDCQASLELLDYLIDSSEIEEALKLNESILQILYRLGYFGLQLIFIRRFMNVFDFSKLGDVNIPTNFLRMLEVTGVKEEWIRSIRNLNEKKCQSSEDWLEVRSLVNNTTLLNRIFLLPELQLQLLLNYGIALLYNGNVDEAEICFRRDLTFHKCPYAVTNIAFAASVNGKLGEAWDLLIQAENEFTKLDEYFFSIKLFVSNLRGEAEIARDSAAKMLAQARGSNSQDKYPLGSATCFLVDLLIETNNIQFANELISWQLEHIKREKDCKNYIRSLLRKGRILLMKGQVEKAERFITQGLNVAEETQNQLLLVEGTVLRAELLYHRKQFNEIISLLNNIEEIASSNQYRLHLLRIQSLKILCMSIVSGNFQGQKMLRELLGEARDFNAKREEAFILKALIYLAQAEGGNNLVTQLLMELLDLKILMRDGDCETLICQFQSFFQTESEVKDRLAKAAKAKIVIASESLTNST